MRTPKLSAPAAARSTATAVAAVASERRSGLAVLLHPDMLEVLDVIFGALEPHPEVAAEIEREYLRLLVREAEKYGPDAAAIANSIAGAPGRLGRACVDGGA